MSTKKRIAGSIKNKITASEILEEREKINFDQEELYRTYFSDEKARALMERSQDECGEDDILRATPKYYEWTPKEIQFNWYKKLNHLYFNKDREFYFGTVALPEYQWNWAHQGQAPIGLHLSMFRETIRYFGSDEQVAKWLPKINNFDIAGCYAQTEIGHGSDVAGLETTAVFDKETDEFVINTPNQTSTKWWPGELGKFANHAAVFARVIIGDNDYGVMPFVVQIRSLEDHKHLSGIVTGDIGPKFGYHSKDNGWMTMKDVRVPRDQLLQRFIKVDRNGEFSIEGDLRVIYAVMLTTRTQIISAASLVQALCSTIAIRYSVVRRQFKNISGQKEEVQLIDYQTQQMKLFPILANMLALKAGSNHLNKSFKQLVQDVMVGEFGLLDYCHHLSSGMKAIYTQDAFDNIVLMRQALGGAGYSAWSGIPRIIEDYSPNVTFEGDNTVMAQ